MNNWLDKYENGGGVLKQKTKDNYGKKPNPNDVDATLPPGFVGMGNNIKGRNYSPAWGGQFAMGGNLPGAVGNMYARHGAPSNGPYAKKTKASAQNGIKQKAVADSTRVKQPIITEKETFTDSRNLPEITIVGSKDKQTRDFYNNILDEIRKEVGNPESEYDSEMGTYSGIMALGKQYGFPKVNPAIREGLFKNVPGHYNPLTKTIYANNIDTWIAEMAHHVQMKDNFIEKGTQWLNNDLPQYVKKPIIDLKNKLKYGKDTSPLDYSDIDFAELKTSTPYTKKGTVENEAHSIIEPLLKEKIKSISKNTKEYNNGGKMMSYYQAGLDFEPKTISRDGVEIAQDGKSVPKDILIKQAFRESGLDPEAVSPVGAVGLTQIMPITHKHYLNATKEKPGDLTDPEYSVKVQKWVMDDLYNRKALNNPNQSEEVKLAKVLAGYNWGMGNLTKALDKAKQNTDIYKSLDWMKMLPKETSTYINQILLNKDPGFEEEFQEAIKTSPYTKLYEQPEESKKFTSNVPTIFDLGKQPKSFQDGGEIAVDPEGYWNPENWGNPVIIPSTDITMEDVYEPLIGISNTGDMQYMEPGEDYEFDGEYVTEFPIAKKGISINQADAKPIEKLDQLLNFTNYNKPTKGGWLDKYQ
jgi:hypothetical protein